MVKKVGIFSDLHGDKNSLELIVKTLKKLGLDSALFLGDALYKTMADFTNSELNKAHIIRNKLMQESPLRKDVLDGLFSDQQLQRYSQAYQTASSLGKKIAQAEYMDIKSALSDFDLAVLGGNWDYREEIAQVFGNDYLNASGKQIAGLNVLGFSGGGSGALMTAINETLADNPSERDPEYHTWAQALLSRQLLQADLLISHVPFSDGEGVEKENAVEHLKSLVKKRKQAGLDLPSLYMWGHRHTAGEVRYDQELEGFVVSPGCSSSNHNENFPTFMVSEFNHQNQLVGVQKYEIYSSLTGLSEVRLVGHYAINFEGKKVEFKEKNQTIIREKNLPKLKDNLSLDNQLKLTQSGLNINYSAATDFAEKDLLLRRNILIIQDDIQEKTQTIKLILGDTGRKYLLDQKGKIRDNQLEKAIGKAHQGLAKEARKVFGVKSIQVNDQDEEYMLDSILIQAAFGIQAGKFNDSLRKNKPKSREGLAGWGSGLIEVCHKNLNSTYQNYIFRDLEPKDFQGMAESYLPFCYERTKELDEDSAFKLWLKSYQEGLITSGDIEETNAYQKKEGFEAQKRTKQQIGEMFGFNKEKTTKPEENMEEPPQQIPPEQLVNLLQHLQKQQGLTQSENNSNYSPAPIDLEPKQTL